MRDRLLSGGRAVVQARAIVQVLHGVGGVGKTELAVEYAHRFASHYDVVWWIAAERAALIGEQFAALARALGCAEPGWELTAVRQAVHATLRERDRWLLVFDNAENPEDIAAWLPRGHGHVLVTSRARDWDEIAEPVEVDVLARAESVAILQGRVDALPTADADQVARAMGDLPLAIVQAAAYLADTGAAEIPAGGRPSSYPHSLAAVTRLAFERLRGEDPAAADLAGICAFFAPEPVPVNWFAAAAARLPDPLGKRAADPVAWRRVLARLERSALARVDHNQLRMHRLTQGIVRDHLTQAQARATRDLAGAILTASHPGDADMPANWPRWAHMLPHLLLLDPPAAASTDLWEMANDAARYLVTRGDARTGHEMALRLRDRRRDQAGPDDRYTRRAASTLAEALRQMGRYAEARELAEDNHARERRISGEDHRDTLAAAHSLAENLRALGEIQAARELDEDTLTRRRRTLGDDHPDTLVSANNLAANMYTLGETQAARELHEDTLTRRRRTLGDDHPGTLSAANNLANDLRVLGDAHAARALHEDTLTRCRRILGEDHPNTLTTATNLAHDLRAIGEMQAARELDEDTLARRRARSGNRPRTGP
ncbi:MAG: tetratricopeptide repeat protein [Streptosporangiaceae bacterium]|nr:tetratricopeptide repeat protein [Streptosporangiaceae bacterium]